MKAMSKNDLIALLEDFPSEIVYNSSLDFIFEKYGDDYFKESSYAPYELCNVNNDRLLFLETVNKKKVYTEEKLVAVLTEIQLECEENTIRWYCGRVDGKSDDVILLETLQDIIQQKINKLKGEEDGKIDRYRRSKKRI